MPVMVSQRAGETALPDELLQVPHHRGKDYGPPTPATDATDRGERRVSAVKASAADRLKLSVSIRMGLVYASRLPWASLAGWTFSKFGLQLANSPVLPH